MYVIAVVMQTQGQRNRSVPKRFAEVYFKQFQKLTLIIAKILNSFYMLQCLYLIDWAVGSNWGFTLKIQLHTLEHLNEDFDVKTMVIGSRVVDGKRVIGRGVVGWREVLATQPQLLDRFQQTSVPKCLLVYLKAPF